MPPGYEQNATFNTRHSVDCLPISRLNSVLYVTIVWVARFRSGKDSFIDVLSMKSNTKDNHGSNVPRGL